MKITKSKLLLPLLVLLVCANGCASNRPGSSVSQVEFDEALYPKLDFEGTLDILAYIEGQNGTIIDLGNPEMYAANDILDEGLVRFVSAARAFKRVYPKISINYHYSSIDQYYDTLANYQAQFGHLPHIMHLVNAPQQGLYSGYNADLAKYDYISYYNLIREEYWDLFTFGDFVCAVPFMIYPTGLFINTKALEDNYYEYDEAFLDEWTFEKMIEIAQNVYEEGNFGGLGVMNDAMINCMVESINAQLINEQSVNLNTPEVISALSYENQLAQYSIYDYSAGRIKESFNANGVYDWSSNENFIWDEKYLMEVSRPFCALLYSYMMEDRNKQDSFDYIPYPRLDENSEMSIGVIAEGLVVGNQCPIDATGVPNCGDNALAEEAAAAFAMFMVADTNSVKELSQTEWTIYGMTANGSTNLPVIKDGFQYSYNDTELSDYAIQREIYFNEHSAFKDKIGFQKIMDILENHPEQQFAYNAMLRLVPSSTQAADVDILNEWNSRYRSYAVKLGETAWLGSMTAYLPDWTNSVNANIDLTYLLLQEKLDTYYEAGKYQVIPE